MGSEVDEVPENKEVVLLPLGVEPARGLKVQHLMFAVGLCAVVMCLAIKSGIWLLILGLFLLIACVIGGAVILAQRTNTQRESLLWALSIASERSLPLAPAALAFQEQYGQPFRWRVRLLASYLNEGLSLPDAVDRVPGLISREARVLLRTGWSANALTRSLRLAASLRSSRQTAWGSFATRFIYLGFAFLVMQIVAGFILYFIVPRIEAIFRDFSVQLPAATVFTIQLSHALSGAGGLVFVILLVVEIVLLVILPVGFFNVFEWDLPLIDYLYRRRHTSLVLRSLGFTVDSRQPIAAGIEALSGQYPSVWVRRRLKRVNTDVRNGVDWVESLEENNVIRPSEAAVISSAQRVGNLGWALSEMAESSERRLGYRLQFWLQLLFPLLVLGMGALTFLFAVAYFSPLVRLIEVLADDYLRS